MMPASGGDPVSTALRLSLNSSQNSTESKNLDKNLFASATRVLLHNIEYEPVGNCLSTVLNHLKSKYIPLKSQDVSKNGMDVPLSSHASVSGTTNGSSMKAEPDSLLPSPKIVLFPPENVQLGWRGSHCVGAGMINVGNTCYLNSTLQALFHIPAFVNWLHSDTQHLSSCSIANGTVNGECIICAMNKTLKASENKTGGVIKPFLICNKLKFICKHLVHGQQEDAHEFMRYLLESMEKAYLSRFKGTKLDVYSKETTPLNQIFGGYIRTEVTCLQCNGVSTTFQHCQDLLLDIRRATTLDEALASYFCKERLDGDDAYRCERCHRKVSATKKFSIEKPPQVLCIQLKRFSILGGKINKHVSFTQRLDLTNFLCPQSTCKGPLPLTYHLVSMVTHVGPSVHCGHYTAVAQTSTGQYYHFDDVIVRPISLQSVLDTNAYIMMYEREPYHSPQHSAVCSTVVSPVLNGQKQNSLAIRGTTVSLNSKLNPSKHKPSSLVMNSRKTELESNKPNLTTFGPLPLPPAKERREKISAEDGDSGSQEEDNYEWVEKTRETLELEYHQRDVNGSCWDGSHKSSVISHLTNLSHRGYGTSNVTTWAGERSRMDEELQRDQMEDRKRSYENSYDDDMDRGRVKKVKHQHSDQHHKYNRFQEYHNFKQWTNNSNYSNSDYYKTYSNKSYYHYNSFSSRHKVYNGRSNGYNHGSKYRNHYSKRDSWHY